MFGSNTSLIYSNTYKKQTIPYSNTYCFSFKHTSKVGYQFTVYGNKGVILIYHRTSFEAEISQVLGLLAFGPGNLGPSFLICKMGRITEYISLGCGQNYALHYRKHLINCNRNYYYYYSTFLWAFRDEAQEA